MCKVYSKFSHLLGDIKVFHNPRVISFYTTHRTIDVQSRVVFLRSFHTLHTEQSVYIKGNVSKKFSQNKYHINAEN